jgi:serine/threonine-protein kinase SRPK3
MLSLPDDSSLEEFIQEEWSDPSPRKLDGDRVIYASRGLEVPDEIQYPVICDLGDARFGDGPFFGEVMPDLYRAPEIVLRVAWDEKIDIWALGLMVSR